jgi:hypothetical protein
VFERNVLFASGSSEAISGFSPSMICGSSPPAPAARRGRS